MAEAKDSIKKLPRFLIRFGINRELDFFLENLSSLLSAGIPILDALVSIESEIRSRKLKRIIHSMGDDIAEGKSLSYSLENSGLFSSHVSALIHMGEKSGKLVENLKIIAIEEQKRRALTSKIRSAAMYPIFVLSLTLVIGVGIAWFILPKLATVFSQLKISLPIITKILITFGKFLNNHGAITVLSFFILLIIVIYILFFNQKSKRIGEYMLFILPGSRTLLKEAEITRLGYLLGTLLSAGLSASDALRSLAESTSFSRYKNFYLYLAEGIEEGNSFKKNFDLYKNINRLIPPSIQRLIVAGEKSGSLPTTFLRISETYEEKADITAKNLAAILEPILLVIVWLGVVAVAMAVILPIYSLVGQLNSTL